jgi:hypothetical protein
MEVFVKIRCSIFPVAVGLAGMILGGLLAGCGAPADQVSRSTDKSFAPTQDQITQVQNAMIEKGVSSDEVNRILAQLNFKEMASGIAERAGRNTPSQPGPCSFGYEPGALQIICPMESGGCIVVMIFDDGSSSSWVYPSYN